MNAQIFNTIDQRRIGVAVDHYVSGTYHSSRTTELSIDEARVLLSQLERAIRVASQDTIPERFDSDAEFAGWLCDNPGKTGVCAPEGWYDLRHFTSDGYGVVLMTSKPVPTEQVDALARYFFEGPFAGEYYGTRCVDESDGVGRLFMLDTDFTKSRRDDWGDAIDGLWAMLDEGSPVRKTDRTGPRGTRAVEGLHCDLWVAFR